VLSRTLITKIVFIFLPLALAVFSWGLQYKLSLYDPPHAISHSMPHAKLLSSKERVSLSSTQCADEASSPGPAGQVLRGSFVVWALALMWSFLRAPGARPFSQRFLLRSGQRVDLKTREAGLSAFFFRPPPRLA
jgi:hypothetical protein